MVSKHKFLVLSTKCEPNDKLDKKFWNNINSELYKDMLTVSYQEIPSIFSFSYELQKNENPTPNKSLFNLNPIETKSYDSNPFKDEEEKNNDESDFEDNLDARYNKLHKEYLNLEIEKDELKTQLEKFKEENFILKGKLNQQIPKYDKEERFKLVHLVIVAVIAMLIGGFLNH